MTTYNFDKITNRKGTNCLKYDFAVERGKPADVLPLWVADMDFPVSEEITKSLHAAVEHGIYGYTQPKDAYYNAVMNWMERNHNWKTEREWIVKTPGVVFALAMAVKAFTKVGDSILVQQPVYYPFSEVIRDNDRVIVSNDLILGDDNRYHIDLADFEKQIVEHDVKLFLLCNPHNPSGRAFTKEELTAMGDICVKHGVTVVSDEIHNDFVFRGEHTVFASIKKEFEDICVVCTSPSKTFNLASMMISNIFVPNKELRQKFQHQVDAAGISQLGVLGLVAAQTAYEKGDEWYENMLAYVWENIAYVKKYVKDNMPGVNVIDGEGTYLLWLDFRATGIDADELDRRIIYDAKLWLDSGKIFGKTGTGFQRINVAVPRKTIEECMKRIEGILK